MSLTPSHTRSGRSRSSALDADDPPRGDLRGDPIPSQLSDREQAIVIGLCDGLSRDDVARRIGRSRSTLDKSISLIYASTGFQTAYQLVAWGFRSGLYAHGASAGDAGRELAR